MITRRSSEDKGKKSSSPFLFRFQSEKTHVKIVYLIVQTGENRPIKVNSKMASSGSNLLPQDILDKIYDYLKNAKDKLLNIIIFFSKEETITQRSIQLLRTVFDDDKLFHGMVDSLAEDTEKLKNDANYYPIMAAIWNYFIKPNIEYVVDRVQRIDLLSIVSNMNLTEASATYNFIATLSRFPQAAQKEIVELIMNAAQQVAVYPTSLELLNQSFNNLLIVTASPYGKYISVGLLAVFLTYDIWNNVRRWWKGEITGEQCAKNIINSCAGVAGGIAGGYVGAKVGSCIAPGIGTVVGAVVGGVIGSALSSSLSQWLTEYFFKSPKEKTLEDAYKFLKLNSDASIDEINDSFRSLANEYNPYIVGSNDNFEKLQYHMSIIKLHKGEF